MSGDHFIIERKIIIDNTRYFQVTTNVVSTR
jgi:hypothetical protein